MQEVLNGSSGGNTLAESTQLVDLAFSLLTLRVPSHWIDLVGPSSPPATWPLKDWVQDIVLRFVFLDRVLIGGLSKTPTYWLGGFFNPNAFLRVVQQVGQILLSTVVSMDKLTFVSLRVECDQVVKWQVWSSGAVYNHW